MFGLDSDEPPDATVERIRERLAPDGPRSPSTVLERAAALDDVSFAVRDAEAYPALLADVAEVLLGAARRDESDAARLFGLATASAEVRRACVRELDHLDVDRRIDADAPPDADDRLLPALAALVRDGDVLDPDTDLSGSLATFPDDAGMPTSVVGALDDLLFAASDDLIARHARTLETTRRAVLDRVLAPDGPGAVARTDARIAAILLVQPALDAANPDRASAVVDRLTAAPEPLVRGWGHLVALVRGHDAGDPPTQTSADDALSAAVQATLRGVPSVSVEHERLAARMLSRAISLSSDHGARLRWFRQLSVLALGLETPVGLDRLDPAELHRVLLADAVPEEGVPVLLEGVHEVLTATGYGGASDSAVDALETLADVAEVPTAFADRLLRSLATALDSDDRHAVPSALDAFELLFDVSFDLTEPTQRAVAESASSDALREAFAAVDGVRRQGDDEAASDAARVLRNVAVAAPFDDDLVRETYDDVVDTAVASTGRARDRAALAVRHAAHGRVLSREQARRYLAEQRVRDLAGSTRCVDATEAILSTYDVDDAFDVGAFAAAMRDRVRTVDRDALETIASALETVVEAHSFDDPTVGIEFVAAAVDAVAREYRATDGYGHLTGELRAVVRTVPQPRTTAALSPLLERIRSDDVAVRRATVHALDFGTPTDDPFVPFDDETGRPLLTGSLVHPFVDPLVDHVQRGDSNEGFQGGTLSVLARYADAGFLTDAHLDAVAALAVSLFDHDETRAATLLQSDPVLDRLASCTVDRVFETYVAGMEPVDVDDETVLGVSDVDEDPNGTLGVVDALLEGDHVTAASFVDAVPVRELGDPDAPSLSAYLDATHPATPRLLSLLETTGALARASADPSPALDRALASGSLSTENRFRVLENRTTVETTAELESSPSERGTE